MRVTGGEYGGRRIAVPSGEIRPAMDRMRESLFSILTSAYGTLEGLSVLDLFSGSGSMALEALSRGARSAVLVERDRGKAAVIRENLAHIEPARWKLVIAPAERYVKRAAGHSRGGGNAGARGSQAAPGVGGGGGSPAAPEGDGGAAERSQAAPGVDGGTRGSQRGAPGSPAAPEVDGGAGGSQAAPEAGGSGGSQRGAGNAGAAGSQAASGVGGGAADSPAAPGAGGGGNPAAGGSQAASGVGGGGGSQRGAPGSPAAPAAGGAGGSQAAPGVGGGRAGSSPTPPFDLVFADPPFRYPGKARLLRAVAAAGLLAPGGRLVLHFPKEDGLEEPVAGLELVDRRAYGRSIVQMYEPR
jgi:16S rRNA G966 N2-methylase RsmD